MDNLPATMTLGRRGHYASLRTSGGATGTAGRGGAGTSLRPLSTKRERFPLKGFKFERVAYPDEKNK